MSRFSVFVVLIFFLIGDVLTLTAQTSEKTRSAQSYDAKTIVKYDRNANGLLDPAEIDAMEAAMAAAEYSREIANLKALQFGRVTSAKIARIDQTDQAAATRKFAWTPNDLTRVLGRKVVGEWKTLDATQTDRLGAALSRSIGTALANYQQGGLQLFPFCAPNPGLAVRLQTDLGPREFLVCLECGWMQIGSKDAGEGIWSVPKPLLEEYYNTLLASNRSTIPPR